MKQLTKSKLMRMSRQQLLECCNATMDTDQRILLLNEFIEKKIEIPEEYMYHSDIEIQYMAVLSNQNLSLLSQMAGSKDRVISSLARRRLGW